MTKKDYELIAFAIATARIWAGTEQKSAIKNVAYYISDALQKENTRFDRDKFLKACGTEAENKIEF